jgi:hypothetical protein
MGPLGLRHTGLGRFGRPPPAVGLGGGGYQVGTRTRGGKKVVNRSVLGMAVAPSRSLDASISQPMDRHPAAEEQGRVASPKIDGGEALASEVASTFSVDADFLRAPGPRGPFSLWLSFFRPMGCWISCPRRELTQRFQGYFLQPYGSPPLRRPRPARGCNIRLKQSKLGRLAGGFLRR